MRIAIAFLLTLAALSGQTLPPVPARSVTKAPGVARRIAARQPTPGSKQTAAFDDAHCISGFVYSVTFSTELRTGGFADQILIGDQTLCPKCDVKPPIFGDLVHKLERAYDTGAPVDACFDDAGFVNIVRIRNAN